MVENQNVSKIMTYVHSHIANTRFEIIVIVINTLIFILWIHKMSWLVRSFSLFGFTKWAMKWVLTFSLLGFTKWGVWIITPFPLSGFTKRASLPPHFHSLNLQNERLELIWFHFHIHFKSMLVWKMLCLFVCFSCGLVSAPLLNPLAHFSTKRPKFGGAHKGQPKGQAELRAPHPINAVQSRSLDQRKLSSKSHNELRFKVQHWNGKQ